MEIREDKSLYRVTLRWVDGSTTQAQAPRFRPFWAPEEQARSDRLLASPECQLTAQKRNRWIRAQLAATGYERSLEAVQKKVKRDTATAV